MGKGKAFAVVLQGTVDSEIRGVFVRGAPVLELAKIPISSLAVLVLTVEMQCHDLYNSTPRFQRLILCSPDTRAGFSSHCLSWSDELMNYVHVEFQKVWSFKTSLYLCSQNSLSVYDGCVQNEGEDAHRYSVFLT